MEDIIVRLEKRAIFCEKYNFQYKDSEIEFDLFSDGLYICEYVPSHERAYQIEKFCDTKTFDTINIEKLNKICDKHDWSYVL